MSEIGNPRSDHYSCLLTYGLVLIILIPLKKEFKSQKIYESRKK